MHLNDGQLRAYLDQEASNEEIRHLAACALCQNRMAEIKQRKERTGQALSFLAAAAEKQVPAAGYELARLKERVTEKENRMQNIFKVLKNRLVWGSAATILLVTAFLSVPTMRAAAAQLLAMFRVQQVAVLPLDPTGLSEFTGDTNLSSRLSQVISESVVETQKAGDPRPVGSLDEASQAAGFAVRLPGSESAAPVLYVHDPMGYEITIDRAKAQAFIDEAGRTDIVLPENIDGKQVSADFPAGVSAAYGECPKPGEEVEQIDPDEPSSSARQYRDCLMLIEYPSPVVSAPDDLDIGQLVELGLEFTGLSPEKARELRSTIDWTSTLVIPIPNNASTYEQVDVDGVSATLIKQEVGMNPHHILVWVKDGVIYSIGGWGTDATRTLEMANSLQ